MKYCTFTTDSLDWRLDSRSSLVQFPISMNFNVRDWCSNSHTQARLQGIRREKESHVLLTNRQEISRVFYGHSGENDQRVFYGHSGESDQLPRTLDSRKSYKQLILFDLKIIQQITYLQRKKLILLSENKITKYIVSITLTDITEQITRSISQFACGR